jgi:hypothetical protein
MTRTARAWMALLVVAMLGLLAVAVWQYLRAQKAEQQLGLDAGRVLSAVFSQARELRVARLTGVALAKSTNDGMVFRAEQETRAPFSVNYFVDLKRVGPGDYLWDSERRVMTVRIPDVTVERASVDLSTAQVWQRGLWVSRKAGIDLQRQASRHLAVTAQARATSDENMAKARAAAVAAVAGFLRQPLAAAGFGDVAVEVRFPWDGQGSAEQMDRSRRPEDVLANRP